MSEDMRDAFEAWITAPPYERSAERNPLTHLQPGASDWQGQYADYQVQLAWEAWQESARRFEAAVGFRRQGLTLHLYRTTDGLRQAMVDGTPSTQWCWLDGIVLHE